LEAEKTRITVRYVEGTWSEDETREVTD